MDERALALRMDERALTSARSALTGVRSGAMACEGIRVVRYAGQVGSHQLSHVQQSCDHGTARALPWTCERALEASRREPKDKI